MGLKYPVNSHIRYGVMPGLVQYPMSHFSIQGIKDITLNRTWHLYLTDNLFFSSYRSFKTNADSNTLRHSQGWWLFIVLLSITFSFWSVEPIINDVDINTQIMLGIMNKMFLIIHSGLSLSEIAIPESELFVLMAHPLHVSCNI